MSIEFPPEVKIESVEDIEKTCEPMDRLSSKMKCVMAKETGTNTLKVPSRLEISDAFEGSNAASLTSGLSFKFKIIRGLRTPRSTETSTTFKVRLMDN